MKCNHCGQDIPQAILDERARLSRERRQRTLAFKRSIGQQIGRARKKVDEHAIDKFAKEGLSIRQICKRTGNSYAIVKRLLGPEYVSNRKKWNDSEIIELAEQNMGAQQIADKLGCHVVTVTRAVKGLGHFKVGSPGKVRYVPKYPKIENEYDEPDYRPWLELTEQEKKEY